MLVAISQEIECYCTLIHQIWLASSALVKLLLAERTSLLAPWQCTIYLLTKPQSCCTNTIDPYWLASRLEGRTISAKIWRIGEAEPPWSAGATHNDPPGLATPTAPIDVGFPGVMVGHVEGGQSVEFGRIWLAGR
jgi:hypothetical protein